jgi:HEAT repeat protein
MYMRTHTTQSPFMAAHQIRRFTWPVLVVVTLALLAPAGPAIAAAAPSKDGPPATQRKLILVLKSHAAPGDKAIACKQLAIYGTKDAVPALAPLLEDPDLASWARIALEAIPGSAADAALRKAMDRLQGKLLVGTINSIGVRRDAKAVGGLGKKLNDKNTEVASAAAVALGRIGGTKASGLLEESLASGPASARPEVAEGCILCAEGFFAHGQSAQAIKLYDVVRRASVPKQKVLEATRGAILARQLDGIPLLLEQLRSPDTAFFGIGLHAARELPGLTVTEALVTEMGRSSPERQPLLLLAVADRNDTAASAAVLEAAKGGAKKARIVAIGALERQGNVSSLPVLLEAAVNGDADVAHAALGALTRLPGNDVDAEVLARLPESRGKTRQVLIDLVGRRRIEQALPAIVGFAGDPDAGVRSAAIQVIGGLGGEEQAATLVQLIQRGQSPTDCANLEAALIAISSRTGARCVPRLLPLIRSGDTALRISALHVMASAGGPAALAAVTSAIDDSDESVRDEAVRTLSTWPNNWPEDSGVAEPMLRLAKYSMKPSYQVLGLRGYLQYVQGDKQFKDEAKVEKVRDVLPLLKRPEEQRLAIGVIGGVQTASALELLVAFTTEPATSDDACSAVLKLAGDKGSAIPKEQRRRALQTVVEKSKQDATQSEARLMLKAIQ